MEILLIHNEPQVREILSFVLEEEFRVQVESVYSLEQAIKLLEQKPALVIYSNKYEGDAQFKRFIAQKTGIPSVLMTLGVTSAIDAALDRDLLTSVSANDLLDNLCVEISRLIVEGKLAFKGPGKGAESEYARIKTSQLLYSCPFKVGVYIRLSNEHFVKIFNAGDRFDLNDLEHYLFKKKVEYFWLRKKDIASFIDDFKVLLEKRLEVEPVDPETTADIVIDTSETIHSLVQNLGFNEPIQRLVKANMMLAVKLMKSAPRLSSILSRFEREKGRYIPAHSTLTAFVACSISSEMGWGSEATFHKLTMAAFLHDAALFNHKLAAVQTLKELEERESEFTAEEVKAYKNHAVRAAEIVRGFTGAPADIDAIVSQHHETADGKGFPRGLSASQVSPLAAVFMIAHEIVDATIRDAKDIPTIIQMLKDRDLSGNFRKILTTIKLQGAAAPTETKKAS